MIAARRGAKLCRNSNLFSIRSFIFGDYSNRNDNSSEICLNTSKNAQVWYSKQGSHEEAKLMNQHHGLQY